MKAIHNTELKSNNNKNIIVAIHISQNKDGGYIQEIQSFYGKNIEAICLWIKEGFLIWYDKKKIKDLFLGSGSNCLQSEQVLNLIAKI